MPRVRRGPRRRQKRKKILARAKGYYQAKSKLYRYAREAVDRSLKFAYIGRRLKKRDFRSLWIIRIGAGARQHGLSYSRFMHGLNLAGIELNRKMLAEMAVRDPDAFGKLSAQVSRALEAPRAKQPEAAPGPLAEPAATEAQAKTAETPPAPAEAVPVTVAETAPAEAVKAAEAEAKEAEEAPSAEVKPAKKVRKPAAKKAAPKTVPEEESSVSEASPKAPKPSVKPATAAKPRKSSVAKKKAAKPSKTASQSKSKSKGSQKPTETTSSD